MYFNNIVTKTYAICGLNDDKNPNHQQVKKDINLCYDSRANGCEYFKKIESNENVYNLARGYCTYKLKEK